MRRTRVERDGLRVRPRRSEEEWASLDPARVLHQGSPVAIFRDDSTPTLLTLRLRPPTWVSATVLILASLMIGRIIDVLGGTPGLPWTIASLVGAVVLGAFGLWIAWTARRFCGRLFLRPTSLRLVRAGQAEVYSLAGATLERKQIESGEVGLHVATSNGDLWLTRSMVGRQGFDELERQLRDIL
jgi:hypothetical protein